MKLKIKIVSIGAAAAMLMLSTAHAGWAGDVKGVIQGLNFTGGASPLGRVDVSVSIAGTSVMCSGGAGYNWAYINTVDPNYPTIVAALMMAKSSGSQIEVFTLLDSNGWCHIGYVSIT